MNYRLVIQLLISSIIVASVASAVINENDTEETSNSWFTPEFSVLQKVYDDCQDKNDFTGCLKGKALSALSKAVEQESIPIMDGIVLEKQNGSSLDSTPSIVTGKALDGFAGIDRALLQKLDTFLRTHVLKVDMSEGRDQKDKKKKDKKKNEHQKYAMHAFLIGMGIAGPLGLKILGSIATKALLISKIALTIATVIALKKLYSKEEGEEGNDRTQQEEYLRRNAIKSAAHQVQPQASPQQGIADANNIDPYRYYYTGQGSQ